MFLFASPRPSRRPSLTPMIDVVFLLLVFFMLAARFGHDLSIPLTTSGSTEPYEGPPRLVTLDTGTLALNGRGLSQDQLVSALNALMATPSDVIFVQPQGETSLQDLINVMDILKSAGFTSLSVVAAP